MISEDIDQSKHKATKKAQKAQIGLAAHGFNGVEPLCFLCLFVASVLSETPATRHLTIPHHPRTAPARSDSGLREPEMRGA
jgi:hypothetical protein